MIHTIDPSILERLLEPVTDSLNLEAAERLLAIKADARLKAQTDRLAKKCNQGTLTPAEKAEYESIVTADNIISILKAKARYLLKKKAK